MIKVCTGGLWGMANLMGMLDDLRSTRIETRLSEVIKDLDTIV